MTTRRAVCRTLLSAGIMSSICGAAVGRTRGRPQVPSSNGSYDQFLQRIRAEGQGLGVSSSVLDAALALSQPNQRVLQLDRHQPEFTLTWAQYRAKVISPMREQNAAASYNENKALLADIWTRYRVDPRVVVGIWGLESNFGTRIGTFNVIDSLATLAFDGRRASFFHSELINALRILGHGDIAPAEMLGSYAGAMGQPQFMPSSYLRYAVDYTGDGHRDIWANRADVFASIANYLGRCGWSAARLADSGRLPKTG